MPQEQKGVAVNEGNLVVVLNATMTDERNGEEKKEQVVNAVEITVQSTEMPAEQQMEQQSEQKQDISSIIEASDEHAFRHGNWTSSETLVLLEAKRKEQDMFSGSRRSVLTSEDKWKFIADYCRTRGVQRSKEQCRFRWDNMLPDFRKVKEFEEKRPAGNASFFDLEIWERKLKQLPSTMNQDVYQRIDEIMCNRPAKGGLSGLKREARERKSTELITTPTVEATMEGVGARDIVGHEISGTKNGGNGFNAVLAAGIVDYRGKDAGVVETIGSQLAAAGPKRRRKRRGVEKNSDGKVGHTHFELGNNSPLGEVATAIVGKSDGPPSGVCVHEESAPVIHMIGVENKDLAFRQGQNGQTDRGSPSVARDEKVVFSEKDSETTRLRDCEKSAELLSYIEDRKDARHKELLALEREKLAAFREASFTVANALNNAVSIFSKVAEELLWRR